MSRPLEPVGGPLGSVEQLAPGRAEATREALLRAAGQQFAAEGYHGASLTKILERVGVTKGALYFHFPSKKALAEALLAETVRRKRDGYAAACVLAADPLTALIAGVDAVVQLSVHDPVVRGGNQLLDDPMVATVHARDNYSSAQGLLRRHLEDAAALGLLRPEADPASIAASMTAAIAGHRLICERADTLEELPVRISTMWRMTLPLITADTPVAARFRTAPGSPPSPR
ncbi:MAG TPA: TetR/AcrR family transcriptional regulator [Pseudonocardia sp.]|jgi:AcrR family transcriptional regulator